MSDDVHSEILLKRLHEVFPDPAVASDALKSLDRIEGTDPTVPRYGVKLAVLKLCGGKLWRLRELVQQARKDFRDVPYVAQAPESIAASGRKRKSPVAMKALETRDQDQWLRWIGLK